MVLTHTSFLKRLDKEIGVLVDLANVSGEAYRFSSNSYVDYFGFYLQSFFRAVILRDLKRIYSKPLEGLVLPQEGKEFLAASRVFECSIYYDCDSDRFIYEELD